MKIEVEVPEDRIANMMTSFVESGDPVSTARRGGWCVSVTDRSDKSSDGGGWYDDPAYFANELLLFEVVELDDERTGHETKHLVNYQKIVRGLTVVAQKFPHLFKLVLEDDTDAPCADIFMQCVLFGEEKYA